MPPLIVCGLNQYAPRDQTGLIFAILGINRNRHANYAVQEMGDRMRVKAPKTPIPTEDQEQMAVVQYLQAKGLLFTHPANGSNKSPSARVRFKKLGQSAGCPDLLIFNPFAIIDADSSVLKRAGMAIEMKRRKGGVTSPAQKEWRRRLLGCGWTALVCNGADEAISLIDSVQWVKV